MPNSVLVIVDTAAIQSYIFSSNRLRESIGASYLVAQATEAWAREALHDGVEVYAGGGNFVAQFPDGASAKAFSSELSERVLTNAPNLQLIIHHEAWHGSLRETVREGFKALNKRSRARAIPHPLLGLGVTVMCHSTGLPAVGMTDEIRDKESGEVDETSIYPASAEVLAKWAVVNDANKRLHSLHELKDSMVYPLDFDNLGRTKGEDSHIAVVHADGDGLGQLFQDLAAYDQPDEVYKTRIQKLSEVVNLSAQNALRHILSALEHMVMRDALEHFFIVSPSGEKIQLPVRTQKDGTQTPLFPFRPLVFGGDDVTFVCDGRLGLALAVEYLCRYEEETSYHLPAVGLPAKLLNGQTKLTACAGIAMVKSHYPFARAYDLAERLCGNAKKYRRKHNLESCFDWHFALSGLSGDLEEIRQREYTSDDGRSLVLRPVTLRENPQQQHRAWAVVQKGIDAFTQTPRNKAKALRDALRQGDTSVAHFIAKFNEGNKLPDLGLGDFYRTTGWNDGSCGYFDALELADHYLPLKELKEA
ncbi:hypothetical protein ANRL4_03457 [Anaerolineae bacterium]|nr:hypothetical protein ANRL4_03457 [Anaerolineae bacterium]